MATYTNSSECQARGWFKTHRATFTHDLFAGDEYSRREAWLWLIANAAYAPTECIERGRTIHLERGQLVAGRALLAKIWQWSEKRVRTFMGQLTAQNMIEMGQQKGQVGAVITICNYERFQSGEDCEGQQNGQLGASRTSFRGQLYKEEESKNNNISPPRAHANSKPHANLPSNVHPMSDWMAGSIDRSVTRDETTGRLRLDDRLRTEWLERFKGDEQSLDLALIEADGSIQAHSRQPLRPQVERVLARKAADKHDRDARYAKAAASKPAAQRPRERAPDVWEFLQSEAAAAGGAA